MTQIYVLVSYDVANISGWSKRKSDLTKYAYEHGASFKKDDCFYVDKREYDNGGNPKFVIEEVGEIKK